MEYVHKGKCLNLLLEEYEKTQYHHNWLVQLTFNGPIKSLLMTWHFLKENNFSSKVCKNIGVYEIYSKENV